MHAAPAHDSVTLPSARVERYDTIVIGGGQSGLATAQRLTERDIECVVLSAESRIGESWRRRWDSLRLFTPARYSGLPGMPFPAPDHHLADKDEVADYLERYAARFDLPVRLNAVVTSLEFDGRRYVLTTAPDGRRFEAANVIVSTGASAHPRIPALSRDLADSVQQLHSSSYRHPFALQEGPVLVVGAGNSGAQIALELSRYRKVWLAGRDTGHLPRTLFGRDVFDFMWPILTRGTRKNLIGRRLLAQSRNGFPLIGIPERRLRDAGITRLARIEAVRGGLPVAGGAVIHPSVIVWCTGFRPDYSWIHLPVFEASGLPRHRRGVVAEAPGLFFTGLAFQHSQSSSLIGGVGADAEFIAQQVMERSPR